MDRRRVSCVQQGHTARPQQRRLRRRAVTAQHIHIPSAGSMDAANCSCGKGYTVIDGGGCGACAAGSFKDVNGSAACHAVSSRDIQHGLSSDVCVDVQ